jgi:hypothetical protein
MLLAFVCISGHNGKIFGTFVATTHPQSREEVAMSEIEISEAAAAMGRKGGQVRAKVLTPERRSEIARNASRVARENFRRKIRAQVAESRLAQGLPEHVTDDKVLGQLAAEVGGSDEAA